MRDGETNVTVELGGSIAVLWHAQLTILWHTFCSNVVQVGSNIKDLQRIPLHIFEIKTAIII